MQLLRCTLCIIYPLKLCNIVLHIWGSVSRTELKIFIRQTLVLEFVWNKMIPRMCKQYLKKPKLLGGMALPNFRFYHWAANIRIFKYWL